MASTRKATVPNSMTSRGRSGKGSVAEVMGAPLRKVPFVLPLSRTNQALPHRPMTAWERLTELSPRRTSAPGLRPTETER